MTAQQVRRWPLALIAAPAAVAVWSGWVGLGALCGFGIVHPFPGFADGVRLNTAITLPVGVEAYGAYALGAWLAPSTATAARAFARWSAVGALGLGMAGQVIYHLLTAAHATRAPWPVVMGVSCLPVVTLAFGAALTHLLRVPAAVPGRAPVPVPAEHVPASPLAPVPAPGCTPVPAVPANQDAPRMRRTSRAAPGPGAEDVFAAELAAGDVPSIRRIRAELHVGQDRARQIQAHLETLTPAGRHIQQLREELREGAALPDLAMTGGQF